jgi:hypothetical protein
MILTVLLAAAVTAGAALPERALPDNPCEIIDATEIAIAGQLVVQPGRRVPSIGQEVEAQKAGRPPAPGRICSFDTGVEFGAISLSVLHAPIAAKPRIANPANATSAPSPVPLATLQGWARTPGLPEARAFTS